MEMEMQMEDQQPHPRERAFTAEDEEEKTDGLVSENMETRFNIIEHRVESVMLDNSTIKSKLESTRYSIDELTKVVQNMGTHLEKLLSTNGNASSETGNDNYLEESMDSSTEYRNNHSQNRSRNVSRRVRQSLGMGDFSGTISNSGDDAEPPALESDIDTKKLFHVKYVHNKSMELKKLEDFMTWLKEVYFLFQIHDIVNV